MELGDACFRFFASPPRPPPFSIGENESAILRWSRLVFQESAKKNGINIDASFKRAEQMREAGFQNVQERIFEWEIGTWGIEDGQSAERERELGEIMRKVVHDMVEAVTKRIVSREAEGGVGVLTKEEVLELAEEAKRDVKEDAEVNGYYMLYGTTIGQAPM